MSEDNKAVARRFYEIFAEGNVDALGEVMTEDAVVHDEQNPFPGEGLEGAKKLITMYREGFPDIAFDIEFQVAEGDLVATRWSSSGTHKGAVMGIEPTGNRAAPTGITIDRIENGKVVETWNNWDTLGLLQSMGAIPQPEGAQA